MECPECGYKMEEVKSVSIKHEGGPDGHEILETEVIKYQICAKSDCANEEIYPVDMEEDRTK
jgi:hypothetical protein